MITLRFGQRAVVLLFYAAGGSDCSWHRLFVDPLSRAMYSSKGPDFEYMQARRQEGVDIHDAVYGLACRNFKDEMAELESRIPVNDMEDKQ